MTNQKKLEWQRKKRREFKEQHGYSDSAYYATGGLRQKVLERDGYRCCECGMTDMEHKEKWGRPITIDHKDRDKKNNTMKNLWTLCLSCHGKKDQLPQLRVQKVPRFKQEILLLRTQGKSYQAIAYKLGFSIAAIWKWAKRWEGANNAKERNHYHASKSTY